MIIITNHKTIRRILIINIIALLVISLTGCKVKRNSITDDEMLYAQLGFHDSLSPILEEMAESYSDYIAYDISEEEFKKCIKEYKGKYEDIQKQYEEFNKKYYLEKPSKEMKMVVEKMEKNRECVGSLLEESVNKGRVKDREELLHLYIERFSEIESNLNELNEIIGES